MCAVCNEARIDAKDGVFKAVGAPTEAALVVLAEKLGLADVAETQRIRQARAADPSANPDGACRFYVAR